LPLHKNYMAIQTEINKYQLLVVYIVNLYTGNIVALNTNLNNH